MYIIVKNEEDINKREIIKKCKKWLSSSIYYTYREWHCRDIPRRIIIQKLLLDEEGKIPNDYKFNCFNGKIEFIEVHTNKFKKYKNSYFDKNWNLLPFTWCNRIKNNNSDYKMDKNISKPKNLNKMVEIAEILSKDFDYVRVDLYSVKNKIYFGELTFTSAGGFEPFFPDKYDLIYGKKIKLKGLMENKIISSSNYTITPE